jgi:hypothetical protein
MESLGGRVLARISIDAGACYREAGDSSLMNGSVLSYTIDSEDRLTGADEGYFSFAERNRWVGADQSIGRPLWDFVAGSTVQKVQRSLVRRVRRSGRRIDLPFRCDGPEVRREMSIQIEPRGPDGNVVFSATVIAETNRPPQALLDPDEPRSEGLIEMCGWCDRFCVDGEWMEVEEASLALGLTTTSELPRLSHGLCPDCAALLDGA